MNKKVIDFFTRKPLATVQDTQENDERTSEDGRFVGSITPQMARNVRDQQIATEALGTHIDELLGEYMFMLDDHNNNMDDIIRLLKIHYDPQTEMLMISEDGKIWVVERREV